MAKVKEGAEKAKEELENAKREIEKRAGALDGVAGTNGRKDSSGTKEALHHVYRLSPVKKCEPTIFDKGICQQPSNKP